MKLVPIRRLARFAYGDSLAAADRIDGPIPVFGSNGSIGWHAKSNTGAPAIIVGRKGSYGALNYSAVPIFAIDTTYYIDPTQTDSNLRWLYYALQTANLDSLSVDTGVPGLSREIAYDTPIPWVDHAKQRKIADFLDRETERIDALVDKKRRLIDLLEEKRTATITHAVTKGLDPTAPMKDSGIPWIGEIPEHWEETSFRHVCKLQRGFDLPESDRESGPVPLVSSSGISDFVANPAASGPGVITGRYGSVGSVHWVDDDYWPLNTTLYSAKFSLGEPRYVFYLLMAMPLLAEAGKSAVPGISREDIDPMKVAVPRRQEQEHIIQFLDSRTEDLDRTVALITTQLTLLAEYREALITAAVTGEIDVDTFENDRHMEEATA